MEIRYKLVYLEWADSLTSNQWKGKKEALEWGKRSDWIVRNIGFLLEENDKYILLASSWCPDSDIQEEQFNDLQKIPTTWIRKRKYLK